MTPDWPADYSAGCLEWTWISGETWISSLSCSSHWFEQTHQTPNFVCMRQDTLRQVFEEMGVDPKDLQFHTATCLAFFEGDPCMLCSYAAMLWQDQISFNNFFQARGVRPVDEHFSGDLVESARMECFEYDCVTQLPFPRSQVTPGERKPFFEQKLFQSIPQHLSI